MVLPLLLIGGTGAAAYYFAEEEVENFVSEGAKVAIAAVEWTVNTLLESLGDFWEKNKLTSKIYGWFFGIIKGISKPAISAYIWAFIFVLFSFWTVKSKIKG